MTEKATPASLIQRQFWLLHRFAPKSPAYNVGSVCLIEGDLDVRALETALNALTGRYPVFRSTFDIDDSGVLMQRVMPWTSELLPVVELNPPQGSVRDESVLERAAQEEIRRPFDLAAGAPLRFRLFRFGPGLHMLVITAHHIVFDLATKDMFAEELAEEFEAALSGHARTKGVAGTDYAAFSAWQEQWMQSGECRKMEETWCEWLDGHEPGLHLRSDRPAQDWERPGKVVPIRLDGGKLRSVRTFCGEERTVPFLVLLTAWALTLARWSGRKRFSVGVPLTNRRRDEFKRTMGCLVNILPLPFDITDNPTMRETLRRVRLAMLHMHRMQEVPHCRLVQLLRPKGTAAETQLFQAGFTFDHPMPLRLGGLKVRTKYVHHGGSQLDAFATLWEEPDAIVGAIEYDSSRFAPREMGEVAERFVETACSMAEKA